MQARLTRLISALLQNTQERRQFVAHDALASMRLHAQHVKHGFGYIVNRAMLHRLHRRATAQAFKRLGQCAVDCPAVNTFDLLEHSLSQLLLHRGKLPVGQLLTALPHVQRQQPTGKDVLVNLLARLVRQLGIFRLTGNLNLQQHSYVPGRCLST